MPWLGPLLCSFLDMNANRPRPKLLGPFLGLFLLPFFADDAGQLFVHLPGHHTFQPPQAENLTAFHFIWIGYLSLVWTWACPQQ